MEVSASVICFVLYGIMGFNEVFLGDGGGGGGNKVFWALFHFDFSYKFGMEGITCLQILHQELCIYGSMVIVQKLHVIIVKILHSCSFFVAESVQRKQSLTYTIYNLWFLLVSTHRSKYLMESKHCMFFPTLLVSQFLKMQKYLILYTFRDR
jgi:hypothetical protein